MKNLKHGLFSFGHSSMHAALSGGHFGPGGFEGMPLQEDVANMMESEVAGLHRLQKRPDELLATAVQFLIEGWELDEAELLLGCSLEVGQVRYIRGSVSEVDITIRCSRSTYERLQPVGVWQEEPALLGKLREAIKASLPSGYGVANLGARASAVRNCSSQELRGELRRRLQEHRNPQGKPSMVKSDPASEMAEAPAKVAAETTDDEASAGRHFFQKSGEFWKVLVDGGAALYLKDSKGARYLDYLLHHPNEPISAFDLETRVQPEKAKARRKDSVQRSSDAEATRAYLHTLGDLRGRRDQANEDGDFGRAERLDEEIEAIEKELKNGGRSKDIGEKARGNVSKAVATVRRRLMKGKAAERAFADHIGRFVSTGYQCVYNQPEGRIWE